MRIDAILISHCYNGITKVYYVGTELSAEDHRKLSIYKPKAPAIADPALFICQRMQNKLSGINKLLAPQNRSYYINLFEPPFVAR